MPEFQQNAQQVLRNGQHFADCHSADDAAMIVQAMNAPAMIAAHLDAEADRRARRRQFTQGIRFAAQEVRARMWEADEPAPEGVRATYNEPAEAAG